MAVKLIYQVFVMLLSWIALHTRSDTANEIEILVLRHQLAVLLRRTPRPQIRWSDRAVIAALARLLPARRHRGLLVTSATILRWHQHLVRRHWTTPPVRAGRPAIPASVRALIVRLARHAVGRPATSSLLQPELQLRGSRRCRSRSSAVNPAPVGQRFASSPNQIVNTPGSPPPSPLTSERAAGTPAARTMSLRTSARALSRSLE